MKIGRITLSDRAAAGVYEDRSGPEIERLIAEAFVGPVEFVRALLPDNRDEIEKAMLGMCSDGCHLVVTTGGTGPAERDVTPEATRGVLEKELPGFGELMRLKSFEVAPTSILSRATAGIRGSTLIINLPGNPKAVRECLPLILPAIAEAIDHIAGFRPQLRQS